MKMTRGLRGADALGEVHGGAPLLVHDADLDGVAGEPEGVLHPLEQLDGGGGLLRAVELRLDDVDAALAAVRKGSAAVEVVLRGEHRDHRVEEAFGDLVAVPVEDRVGVHVDADVAHQHEAAPGQRERAAAGGAVGAVGGESPDDFPAALGEHGFQRALHQPRPVAVHPCLVLGIDGGDRVLAVLDGGHRRFEHDVPDAGPAELPDLVLAVDVQLDVQPVVSQQHASELPVVLPVSGELRRVRELRPGAAGEDGREADIVVCIVTTVAAVLSGIAAVPVPEAGVPAAARCGCLARIVPLQTFGRRAGGTPVSRRDTPFLGGGRHAC